MRFLVGVLVLVTGLLLAPSAHADPAAAPGARTSSVGFGMSAATNGLTTISLAGSQASADLGAGLGVHYAFRVGGHPLQAGLYGMPLLHVADGSSFNFAVLFALATQALLPGVPVGAGIGWRAFAIGGPDPGLHPLHRSQLFVTGFAGFNLW